MIERYIESVLIVNTKATKKGTVAQQLNYWISQIGDLKIKDVTPAIVAAYRDKLKLGVTPRGNLRKPATINHYINNLSHCFTIACKEWGWIKENPVAKVSRLPKNNARVRYLEDDERAKLLQACRQVSDGYLERLVLFAILTGARRGEIESLTWRNIDYKKRLIYLLETKNGESRSVHMSKRLETVLNLQRTLGSRDNHLVFCSPTDPQKSIRFNNAFYKALKIAGIEDFRFHDLRHDAASLLAKNGATLLEIAAVLGHKTLSMVKRYSHLTENHTRGVLERMNASF